MESFAIIDLFSAGLLLLHMNVEEGQAYYFSARVGYGPFILGLDVLKNFSSGQILPRLTKFQIFCCINHFEGFGLPGLGYLKSELPKHMTHEPCPWAGLQLHPSLHERVLLTCFLHVLLMIHIIGRRYFKKCKNNNNLAQTFQL